MPSTSTKDKKLFERACLDQSGAGGEPLGEPPAPPSSVGQRSGSRAQLVEAVLGKTRSGISEELVDAAVEQRRLKTAIRELDQDARRRLADAVIGELAEGQELGEEVSERLLDAVIGGMVASPTPTVPISGDSMTVMAQP